ncbi:MAG TPA: glucoamylase family protein, partial [Thermoanaerobaculia bacterium]|nr:glucoamylase family protein [Thermoanaerobaculia bacterium]
IVEAEQLEQRAEALGAVHARAAVRRGRSLLGALRRERAALRAARSALERALHEERTVTLAAEWLIDNFHLVEAQVRQIQQDLSPGFYRELPKLDEGTWVGLPRVHALAWTFVAHTDSRFDPELLRRFVRGYQRAAPLRIGELWALPIHLRLVLVENLRRLAAGMVRRLEARARADLVADGALGDGPAPAIELPRDLGTSDDGPEIAFAVQLLQRLREQDPETTPLLGRLRALLAARGLTDEEAIRQEHQRQAATQVSVSNVINSMRQISAFDWPPFVEEASLADDLLRHDPAGVYAAQDFETRDLYRHAIEELARGARRPEIEVAERAVARAAAAGAGQPAPAPRDHVGYELVGAGRRAFERELRYRPPARGWLIRALRGAGLAGYLGGTALLTALLLAPLVVLGLAAGVGPLALATVAVLALVPASDLALALVNRLLAALLPPRLLPKLALEAGVPPELRTLVAVPVLLHDAAEIEEQVAQLEVHYLANPEGHVSFALLSDFADAAVERTAEEESLLHDAAESIARLNERYGPGEDGGERFLLLHRRRRWNPGEGCWMGWERKRGKLHELNRLLRGVTDTSFVGLAGGPPIVPQGVRYVITLDADTRLPPGAVRHLVGALAHPLNRARLDPRERRVTAGYAILQPRIAAMLPAYGEDSPYRRNFSGPTGVDPYVAAVSDVYQDLFGEGSYTGKGIYEVDTFEAALTGRVPDNALLSHDLFEGSFARAGLATDVVLFEEFPSHLLVSAARQSRWVRGDWQLLPWLLPRVPTAAGPREPNPLPALARWKMIDNLRRSLSAPSSLLLLVAGWLLLPAPWLWGAAVVALLTLPVLVPALVGLLPPRRGVAKRTHLSALLGELQTVAIQALLAVALLPARAWLRADAIARTLARIAVTRRRLLEWVTAAQAGAGATLDAAAFYRRLAAAPLTAVAALALVAALRPSALAAALPFVAAWLAAPAIARWLSLPAASPASEPLPAAEEARLRRIARRSWSYFERFASATEGFLPPDNFQEDPQPVVAHRTSPTNLGLGLLATVAAHDFGWAGRLDTVERLEATLAAMGRLERFRGHFFNWYDTRSLAPLEPRYVSTVDSGNLAGHLIALASACRELAEAPLRPAGAWQAMADALALAEEETSATPKAERGGAVGRGEFGGALAGLAATLAAGPPADAAETAAALDSLRRRATALCDIASALAADHPTGPAAEALVWTEACQRTAESHARDLAAGAPATSARYTVLAERAEALAGEMDFGFLLDPVRKVLAIGYRLSDQQRDPVHYDLLASEARLASFLAIAKGDAPPTHWLRLGRALTPLGRGSALLSWSGSMFEYLMPSLVLMEPPRSLLGQSASLAVAEQIRYGAERGVPWGISESAYNERDLQLTYQYGPFGVPRLALRRPAADELVVAPYATALATMLAPRPAAANFQRLAALGASGRHGFYEALDFTRRRVREGQPSAVVWAYMAHHQAMTLLALANLLHGDAFRKRFHAHPLVRAVELLLQERTPRDVVVTRPLPEERPGARLREAAGGGLRVFDTPHLATPRVHLLSNGAYSVLITSSGAGWSRHRGRAVTRWREDTTRDDWGTFFYLRDADSGERWSAGYQPTAAEPDAYRVLFTTEKAEIRRTDGALTTTLEVIVSAEDDVELRRLTFANRGPRPRRIEVTSYAELALAPQAADEAHPVFSKLFVVTEALRWQTGLLAARRTVAGEASLWAAHLLAVEGETDGPPQHETDRARFLGRGFDVRDPVALAEGRPLSGSLGPVLDPVFSLRQTLVVPAEGRARLVFATLAAATREEAVRLAEKYAEAAVYERAARLAWTRAQVEQRHFGVGSDEVHLYMRLASDVVFANPGLRAPAAALAENRLGARALWGYGISGDLPLVLLRIDDEADREIASQLVEAHRFWRSQGLAADLVLLNEQPSSYVQALQATLEGIVRAAQGSLEAAAAEGGVFVLRADQMPGEHRALLQAAARAVLFSHHGSLAEQLRRRTPVLVEPPPRPPRPGAREAPPAAPEPTRDLAFFNGLGGFAAEGREYVVVLGEGRRTPRPWINVV